MVSWHMRTVHIETQAMDVFDFDTFRNPEKSLSANIFYVKNIHFLFELLSYGPELQLCIKSMLSNQMTPDSKHMTLQLFNLDGKTDGRRVIQYPPSSTLLRRGTKNGRWTHLNVKMLRYSSSWLYWAQSTRSNPDTWTSVHWLLKSLLWTIQGRWG